jgi:hypothetical protein
MRQLDVPRSDPPTWVDELRISLISRKKSWSRDGVLDLFSAARELEGWLHDPRPYEGHHKSAWLSAVADFRSGANQIGPILKSVLGVQLSQTLAMVVSIKASIENNSPKALATLLPARLKADQVVYAYFKRRWTEPAVRAAAWQDFVEVCRDEEASFDTLAVRHDLFWQLVQAADYAPNEIDQMLAYVLSDIAFYVARGQWRLGDITDDQLMALRPDGTEAGLTEGERLAICQRIIIQPPAVGHRIVWIAFNQAGPGTGIHKMGPVSFWDGEWVRAVVEHGGSNLHHIPSELRMKEGFFRYQDLPEGRDVILARVDLGVGAFTDPVRVATEQAESVVALAGFRTGEARLRRLNGYLHFVDGRLYSTGTFMSPLASEDLTNPRYASYFVAELDRLAPQLQQHLLITNPDLTEVVQGVRWWQQARSPTPLASLLLDVRILELIAKRVGTTWPEYVKSYMRISWVRQSIYDDLREALYEALHSAERLSSQEQQQKVETYRTAIVSWKGEGFTIDLRRCVDALPDLASIFPVHSRLGRRLQSLSKRLESPSTVRAWRDELTDEWSLLADRLQRVRNALAHGGPIQDQGVESVHRFGQRLAAWALSVALEGILEGKTISVSHSDHVQREDTWWNQCSSAANVAEALFIP